MNNSSPSFHDSISIDVSIIVFLAGIIGIVVLSYVIYHKLKDWLEERKIEDAKKLSAFGTIVAILALATLIYAWQNNPGMATATATMVLVIITAFYAWNTHLQVKSMSEQAGLIREQASEMHRQADTMENQFTLVAKNIDAIE